MGLGGDWASGAKARRPVYLAFSHVAAIDQIQNAVSAQQDICAVDVSVDAFGAVGRCPIDGMAVDDRSGPILCSELGNNFFDDALLATRCYSKLARRPGGPDFVALRQARNGYS